MMHYSEQATIIPNCAIDRSASGTLGEDESTVLTELGTTQHA